MRGRKAARREDKLSVTESRGASFREGEKGEEMKCEYVTFTVMSADKIV